ncbi:MAG: hypothetical protein NVS4B8_16740 [Herpetosiphon sp.]
MPFPAISATQRTAWGGSFDDKAGVASALRHLRMTVACLLRLCPSKGVVRASMYTPFQGTIAKSQAAFGKPTQAKARCYWSSDVGQVR